MTIEEIIEDIGILIVEHEYNMTDLEGAYTGESLMLAIRGAMQRRLEEMDFAEQRAAPKRRTNWNEDD